MRILIVNKFLYPNGGSETYIFKIGQQLQKMGHEVQYFGMEHPDRVVGNRINAYTSNMDFHTGRFTKIFYPFQIVQHTLTFQTMFSRLFEHFVLHYIASLNNM